jgi:hypothetical protein
MVYKYFLLPHMNSVSYKFGIVAMMAGLIGVPLGSALAQRFRPINSTCDPLICAFGLISSAPFVYLGLVVAKYNTNWAFFCVFMAEVTVNLCWSIVADMLLVRLWRSVADGINLDDKCRPKKWIMYAELFRHFVVIRNFIVAKQKKVEQKIFMDKESNSPTPISPVSIIFPASHLSSVPLQCQLVS